MTGWRLQSEKEVSVAHGVLSRDCRQAHHPGVRERNGNIRGQQGQGRMCQQPVLRSLTQPAFRLRGRENIPDSHADTLEPVGGGNREDHHGGDRQELNRDGEQGTPSTREIRESTCADERCPQNEQAEHDRDGQAIVFGQGQCRRRQAEQAGLAPSGSLDPGNGGHEARERGGDQGQIRGHQPAVRHQRGVKREERQRDDARRPAVAANHPDVEKSGQAKRPRHGHTPRGREFVHGPTQVVPKIGRGKFQDIGGLPARQLPQCLRPRRLRVNRTRGIRERLNLAPRFFPDCRPRCL